MDELKKWESELNEILILLDQINEDNFSQNIDQINKIAKLLHEQRDKLLNEKLKKDPKNLHIEIGSLIKQINIKFDNIINRIKSEQNDISKELNNFQNQKKLANYHR